MVQKDVQAARGRQGMMLFLLAMLLFAAFDALSKYLLTLQLPALFLNAARYTTFLGVGLVVFARGHGRQQPVAVSSRDVTWLFLRGAALGSAGICFMVALTTMPLGEATAIYFTAPFMVIVFSRWVLREKVSAVKWISASLGFLGMLLIIRPGSSLPLIGTLLMVMAALSYAVYQALTKFLSVHGISNHVQYGSTAIVSFLMAIVPALFFLPDPWPAPTMLLLILLVCFLNAAGHLALVSAFEKAPASTLAPLNYLQLVMAVLFSVFLFHAVPDTITFIGILIVILSGLVSVISRRENSQQI